LKRIINFIRRSTAGAIPAVSFESIWWLKPAIAVRQAKADQMCSGYYRNQIRRVT
jgi:hypothetical protein